MFVNEQQTIALSILVKGAYRTAVPVSLVVLQT